MNEAENQNVCNGNHTRIKVTVYARVRRRRNGRQRMLRRTACAGRSWSIATALMRFGSDGRSSDAAD